MSIATEVKSYADAVVETGRSVLNDGISQSREAINEGLAQTREVLNEGLTQTRATLDESIDTAANLAGSAADYRASLVTEVRKGAYAVVGAGDLALNAIVKVGQELPADVQDAANELAGRVQARFLNLAGKAGEAVGTAQGTVDGLRTGWNGETVRNSAQAYSSQLREVGNELAARGEKVVSALLEDPRLSRVQELAQQAGDSVAGVAAYPARRRAGEQAAATRARNERRAGSASSKRASAARANTATTAGTAKPATARKSAPRKTSVRKATPAPGSTTS